MSENPYEAPQTPIDPQPREYPRGSRFALAYFALSLFGTVVALTYEAWEYWHRLVLSRFVYADLVIYAAIFAAAGTIIVWLTTRLRQG